MNAKKLWEDIAERGGDEQDRPKPERSWRDIAKEVSTEYDSDKVAELSQELIEALVRQDEQRLEQTQKRDEQVRRQSA
jgi:hypothetical protein